MNIANVEAEFQRGFNEGLELGASVAIWHRGEPVLSLSSGYCNREQSRDWSDKTIAPVFSATKGPAAATLMLCLDQAGMNLETEVRRVWREFPISGATFGEMISHQCGLCAIDAELQASSYGEVISAIEHQEPLWEPMTAHGYHPRLGGYMQDECVRRLTGKSLGETWRTQIAEPLEIDFWIGLPESQDHRVATLYAGKMRAEQTKEGFYSEIGRAGTIVNRAFRSPKGVQGAQEMNKSHNWRSGYPAMGGVGSAEGLAKFYQAAMGEFENNPLNERIRQQFNARRVNGEDLVLRAPTSFAGGFMMDPLDNTGNKLRNLIGSDQYGFGHPGAGGSHAFADPATGYSFAYVMNQMEVSVLPGEKVRRMLDSHPNKD